MHRAAHCLLDEAPLILADHFACPFAGFSSDEAFLRALEVSPLSSVPRFPRMRLLFALRNRYAEDELADAVARGVSQYVILGAGLDSFAYRRPDLMRVLHVYEVDHPSSLKWKRERVAQLGIEPPPTLHYVPLDFEHESLAEGLAAGGMNCDAPAFFSWLGVVQYLTRDAVLITLRDIASTAAPGSEIVFQFVVPAETLNIEDGADVSDLAARAAQKGEPWLSFFRPEEMEAELRRIGFGQLHHFDAAQAAARYLCGRTDELRPPAYFHMIKACIGDTPRRGP